MAVGAPVTATDADRDVLNYILAATGDDNPKFMIHPTSGQITTRWGLDREGAAEAAAEAAGSCADATLGTPDTECTVTVTVTDSAGATDTATVTHRD